MVLGPGLAVAPRAAGQPELEAPGELRAAEGKARTYVANITFNYIFFPVTALIRKGIGATRHFLKQHNLEL